MNISDLYDELDIIDDEIDEANRNFSTLQGLNESLIALRSQYRDLSKGKIPFGSKYQHFRTGQKLKSVEREMKKELDKAKESAPRINGNTQNKQTPLNSPAALPISPRKGGKSS